MLSVGQKGRSDCSRFDQVETDILEALLRADFEAPEAEQMEADEILYILRILDERQKADPTIVRPDIEAAKAEFFREYYPLLEDKELLGDLCSDFDKPAAAAGNPRRRADLPGSD